MSCNHAYDRFDHNGHIPMRSIGIELDTRSDAEQRSRLERVKERFTRQGGRGRAGIGMVTNEGVSMNIGPDGTERSARRNSDLSTGAAWIKANKTSGYQGVPDDFLQAAQLASTMEQQARDKKLQRPALWDWTSIESPADSLAVIENGEEAIREYNANCCLAHEEGFTPDQRKIFQRQVQSLRICMHQRIEMLGQFLITEKKKACRRFSHGKPNPTVEEQVAGLHILHERLGNALRHPPEELAYALQHLKAELTYEDSETPTYPEGWVEAASMRRPAMENRSEAHSEAWSGRESVRSREGRHALEANPDHCSALLTPTPTTVCPQIPHHLSNPE